MRKEVSDRLSQSLHQVVEASLLNLPKESQPSQVQSLWQMELRHERNPPQLLPPETTITQVFDQPEVEDKLLILGEPGSGKTTTMLELARELVRRAESLVEQSIPVLINLSSWKPPQNAEPDPSLPWLLAELHAKYGIRQELSQNWLAAKQLLPLLDGLDEVALQHQEACVKAINQWLTADVGQRPMALVVCCCFREYEEILQKRLFLNRAIALRPLTDKQIRTHLKQFGLEEVWHSTQNIESLQALLQKPLFLSIFGFVASQQQFEVAAWQRFATEEDQRKYLLDQYWDAAMTQELVTAQEREQKQIQSKAYGTKVPPNRKVVRRALVFAAQAMEQESLTELSIERIQPLWLSTAKQRWAYRLIFGLIFGLLVGLIFGLLVGLIFGLLVGALSEPILGLIFGLLVGLFLGLIGGLISGLFGGLLDGLNNIFPAARIQTSMSREARRKISKSIRGGLIVGLIVGLIGELNNLLIVGPIGSLLGGLLGGLIVGLLGGLKANIENRIESNQGMKNSRQNMLVMLGIALGLAFLI